MPWASVTWRRLALAPRVAAADHGAQRLHRHDLDLAVAHADQPFELEARQDPAHRLELQAQQAADLFAGHAQQEPVGREPAGAQPLRQVDQERRQPFLGTHRAEQQHQRTFTLDLAGEHAEQLALQRGLPAGQRVEFLERDLDHFAVLQRDGVAGIALGADAVESQHLAAHVEAGDLLAAVLGEQHRLERAGTDSEQRVKRRAEPIQVLPAPDPPARACAARQQHVHVARGGRARSGRAADAGHDRPKLDGGGNCGLHL